MQRFKNILCVTGRGKTDCAALERAASLAKTNGAELTVAVVARHVSVGMGIPENGPLSKRLQQAEVEACAEDLAGSVAALDETITINTEVLVGIQFLEIIHAVLRHDYDLVIKMTEQAEWLGHLLGSEDMHLLRKCPCPVWLVKRTSPKPFRRIIAAVDVEDVDSPEEHEQRWRLNRKILELAGSMALSDGAELHVAHAWEVVGEQTMLGAFLDVTEEKVRDYIELVQHQRESAMKELMGALERKLGRESMRELTAEVHLEKGAVRKVIPALANNLGADLIVMGTVARTGIPGFIIGNTAESILHQIECSVLAIKPEGFETPVRIQD